MDARSELKRFVRQLQSWPLITGKVTAVNEETCDVDPSDGGPTIFDVRLKPAVNGVAVGVIIYPVAGSECIIAELDGSPNKYVLLQSEKVDRLLVKLQGGATIEARNDGTVQLNGDQFGGLVKVQELRQDLNKVNAILGALQQAFQNWTPTSGDSGVAQLKGASAGFVNLPRPTYTSIESNTTRHGSL